LRSPRAALAILAGVAPVAANRDRAAHLGVNGTNVAVHARDVELVREVAAAAMEGEWVTVRLRELGPEAAVVSSMR
jgi:hypothetical protein